MIIKKDSKIVKAKGERRSLGLKAKKESSDDECSTSGSEDEEYAMTNGKSERKCFRCGDPNHLIGCPKPPKNKNQRAFVGGSWSDSGEEDDEKIKDEMCLVAQASNETPYELLRGRKPTLDYFKVFGSKCFILNTKDYLTKFDSKSYEDVFLGYSQNSKACIILNKHNRNIEESLNMTFNETPLPSKTSPLVDDDLDEEEEIKSPWGDIVSLCAFISCLDRKKHDRMMLDSIDNGPLVYPAIEENRQTRPMKYSELTETQQLQDDCDVQATNIILHGLPPDVTSSNLRNQATIQDGRVVVQHVQGRQTQSYAGIGNRVIATTSKGNYAAGQPRVVKCYNCQGEGHTTRQCTRPKRPRNAAWFKEKLMLAEAQKAGQILDEEQLAFLASHGMSEALVAQQTIHENSAFQTEDLDAYDSDCDDLSSAKAVLMENLSSCDPEVLSESQEKDTLIRKLKDRIKSLSEKDSLKNVKKDIDEIETINIELEHSVIKLLLENKNLRKEREHLKSIYKDQFDSVRKTRIQSKDHCDSLIAQINAKSAENSDLNAQLQEKVFAVTALKNELRKLKMKNVVDIYVLKSNATIAPGMFKLDIEPISHSLKNNRDAHEVYIEKTLENTDTLCGFVERAGIQNPSEPLLKSACMFTKHIQELLVYVSQTCPNSQKHSEKLVVVAPMNKDKRVRLAEPVTSSSNIPKQTDSLETKDSNKPLLTSLGVKPTTSASGSKPSSNTKNNWITRPPSSN
nr:retrovirus-related Pol polyprotein from transposon TNT 1-94 [Tanacetum cinerariifolium]